LFYPLWVLFPHPLFQYFLIISQFTLSIYYCFHHYFLKKQKGF